MPRTIELVDRDPISYESAVKKDHNIVNQSRYVPATKALYASLWAQQDSISAIVKCHLRLCHRDTCSVAPPASWIRGSFNVCIPVTVQSGGVSKRLMLRCPMPHKLAEDVYPGTVDEKLGCEVATYVWMQRECPAVRIPHLYGFGFTDHRHFTHEKQQPLFVCFARALRRFFHNLFRRPVLSPYIANPRISHLPTAYMLLEYIDSDTGQMLSKTWDTKKRESPAHRQNLFQGLSRLILSLARIPLPTIGSFQFQHDCTITLTNRPLTCSTIILENDGTPRTMNETYSCTDSFVTDSLCFHDRRLSSNPNAAYDDEDCRGQMAISTVLRAVSPHFIDRKYRNGPFLLQFTDLHASNIFVDDLWNVKCLLDLEWICSLPSEMLSVPYWLTGCAIDEIQGERLVEFNRVREEFMAIFEAEECNTAMRHDLSLTKTMHHTWESKGVWFWYCVESVDALLVLVADHICPAFSTRLSPSTEKTMAKFWCQESDAFVEQKTADQTRYQEDLRSLFHG